MSIGTYSDTESDASVRAKINAAISKVNSLGADNRLVAANYRWLDNFNIIAGSAMAINTFYYLPLDITETFTISELAAVISTVSAGGNIQLGLHANNEATQKPTGTPLVTTGNLSTTTAAAVNGAISPASYQLVRGTRLWMAVIADNAVCALLNVAGTYMGSKVGSSNLAKLRSGTSATAQAYSLANPGAFGVWGDVSASTFVEDTANRSGILGAKISSVP